MRPSRFLYLIAISHIFSLLRSVRPSCSALEPNGTPAPLQPRMIPTSGPHLSLILGCSIEGLACVVMIAVVLLELYRHRITSLHKHTIAYESNKTEELSAHIEPYVQTSEIRMPSFNAFENDIFVPIRNSALVRGHRVVTFLQGQSILFPSNGLVLILREAICRGLALL